jgi:iron-sulfur cluster assembly accessory protein
MIRNFSSISTGLSIKKKLNKAPITLTPTASSKICEMIKSSTPNPLGIRIGIRKRGCNGLSFTMNYVTDDVISKNLVVKDIKVKIENDINIYIDPRSLIGICGSVMDWKEDAITSQFVFDNPNKKGGCGCGESFNL